MQILAIVQAECGRRIVANIERHKPAGWVINTWEAPAFLPPIIDYPEDCLPKELLATDLVLSLGKNPGVAEFLPDIMEMAGAQSVIAPIDNVAWLPPGLRNQVAGSPMSVLRSGFPSRFALSPKPPIMRSGPSERSESEEGSGDG